MSRRQSGLQSKKHVCQLNEIVHVDELSEPTTARHADHYDTFIFKDNYTQSEYTLNNLKSNNKKAHRLLIGQHEQHSKTITKHTDHVKQMMSILGNIKKYRNQEILRSTKNAVGKGGNSSKVISRLTPPI
jgi:hypothetical protein